MKTLAALFTLAVLAVSLHASPAPGQPAPDFVAVDSEGKTHALADYKGKIVVLEWLNHGCPFVKKHYGSGNMQALQKKYTALGVVWLSVVSSAPGKQGNMSPEETRKTKEACGSAATAILLDQDGKVGRAYDAKTTPHMFVIAKDGTLAYAGAIDDKKSPDPSDIAGAKNYVAQAIDEMLAGRNVSEPNTVSYGCSVKY